MQADAVDFGRFWNFMWTRQRELWRFLMWVGEMEPKRGLGKCRTHIRQPK